MPTFQERAPGVGVAEPAPEKGRPWLLLVAGMAIVLIAGVWIWQASSTRVHPLSVAVLPLRNFTGDPGKQYLADKTTDSLITNLGRNRSLRVASATTTGHLAGVQKSLPEIARDLGVRWVVEGSTGYERSSAILKIRAVDALTDRKIWSDIYITELDKLSFVQEQAAMAITKAIEQNAAK